MTVLDKSFSSVHDFLEQHDLPARSGDSDADYDTAVDAMIAICENAEIEFFDIHDLVEAIASHYSLEESELLWEYDNWCDRMGY